MRVEVLQYKQPDGHRVKIYMENMPDDLQTFIAAMKKNKCALAAEVLPTGEVSMTIEHLMGDYAIELCTNGPGEREPRIILEKMIRSFDAAKFKEWLKDQKIADDGCGIGWGT